MTAAPQPAADIPDWFSSRIHNLVNSLIDRGNFTQDDYTNLYNSAYNAALPVFLNGLDRAYAAAIDALDIAPPQAAA